MISRIDAVLQEREYRTDFLRMAIEREIRGRERGQPEEASAKSRQGAAMKNISGTVLKAVRESIALEWAVCDALLQECDGHMEDYKACSAYLAAQGFDYTPSLLSRMRCAAKEVPSRYAG